MGQPFVISLLHNAEKRCDPDSSGQEHRWFHGSLMERERARRKFHLHCGTDRHCFQRPLKGCFTHPSGENQPTLKRCTGNRESPYISFGVGFRRIHQCQVGGLSGSEFESRRLLEMEGHGILRDFNSIQQLGFVAKRNFLSAHNDLLEAPALQAALVLRAASLYLVSRTFAELLRYMQHLFDSATIFFVSSSRRPSAANGSHRVSEIT